MKRSGKKTIDALRTERGFMWNDSDIGIDWPLDRIDEIILSDKDRKWMSFKDSKIKY